MLEASPQMKVPHSIEQVLCTCCSHWTNTVFVECKPFFLCMGSHLFIEHVTTSEVECTKIVLIVKGGGGGGKCVHNYV